MPDRPPPKEYDVPAFVDQEMTDGFATARLAAAHVRFEERNAKMRRLIQLIEEGEPLQDACDQIGMSKITYRTWRSRYPEFCRDFDAARQRGKNRVVEYDGSFISFREFYLGMQTTAFQRRMVDAIEAARPGEVTMILIPPEHGKTTLLEDWCTYKLVGDRSFRVTVASETVDHGIKILGRVKERFEADGPTPFLVRDFGVLKPDERDEVWGAKRFNIAGKIQISDERDYSMSAIGITGRVQGTRSDLMLLDDMQDVKSLELSDKYFDLVVQSFLSRPSMFGRTVIIGTRVGEWDVYRKLMDAQIPDHLVTIPAHLESQSTVAWNFDTKVKPNQDDPSTWAPEGVKFLWPDKYDFQAPGEVPVDDLHRFRYAALRFRVGEQTWWRVYQQRPEASSQMTFDGATTDHMLDTTRSVTGTPRPRDDGPAKICISLDPAIGGGNGVLAAAHYKDHMEVLHCKLDYSLTKYSQIIDLVEEECYAWSGPESVVAIVVVEDKAFQKGLMRDDRLIEVQRRFGFRLVPNTTGKEKADPDIGVPGMPMSMVRQEITIPWADPKSVENMEQLLQHLHIWRPGVPGNKLPQDLTMALWFNWRQWRFTRDTAVHPQVDMTKFASRPSPLRNNPRRNHRRRPPYRPARGGYGRMGR